MSKNDSIFINDTKFLIVEKIVHGDVSSEYSVDNSNNQNTDFFISNNKKIVINVVQAFYHTFIDTLGKLLELLKKYENIEVILISPYSLYYENNLFHNRIYEIVLNNKNIKYYKVYGDEKDFIKINNFYIINAEINHKDSIQLIEEELSTYDNANIATKKIYISRKTNISNFETNPELYRIDNEQKIEEFFKTKGFEIIYTENFSNILDQILFFRDVKVLAGLTGSGLTNSLFMKSGGTVIELNTPFDFVSGREFHNYYKELSYYKKHTWIAIPNTEKNYKSLIQLMEEEMDYKI